jgi:hypothetical protein
MSVIARRARRSTGRLDGCKTLTSMPSRARKRASQNPFPPRFMGQDHAGDLPTRRRAPGLQTLDEGNQAVAKSIQNVSGMPA